jgi:hypothetical protein
MKFGVNSRTNTPYPVIAGVVKAAIGECRNENPESCAETQAM